MAGRRLNTALQLEAAPTIPGLLPHVRESGALVGTVEKILHADVISGFCVLEASTERFGRIVVAGNGDPVALGDRISCDGDVEAHPKWGRQFRARFIRAAIPDTADGIAKYLSRGNIKGVGEAVAERLLLHFGDRLPEAVQSAVTLMAAGIPERKAQTIAEHFALRTRFARLLSLLYSHGLGDAFARKIIDRYGDATMQVVLQTPYRLAREVKGIGFKTADKIALSQNMALDAPERVKAALHHQMQLFGRNGHCAAPRSVLAAEAAKLLALPPGDIERAIEEELAAGELVRDTIQGREVVYLKSVYDCEIEVAQAISARVVSNPAPADLGRIIDEVASGLGIELHANQRLAIETAVTNAVVVVTGGPGTGKTRSVKTFFEVMRRLAPGIVIKATAPTGRAAQRLAESTGEETSTLHRLLEWSPERRGFLRDADNPLHCDVLLVDEGSMTDLWLMRDLLRALPQTARLVIVGDADQLPSVGAGNVLHDMIASGIVPVVRLTHVWRQGTGSAIAAAARALNNGTMPTLSRPARSSDMWGVFSDDPAETVEKVRKIVTSAIPQLGYDPLRDVQVLTPGHDRETGTVRLNAMLQETLNPIRPGEPTLDHKRRQFRLRDRVIQISNNYELEVFNGDVGNIVEIRKPREASEDGEIVVDFDGQEVVYDRSELDQLEHAYAITIHKSQGSEFKVAIVVITTQHFIMLRRNLIYTGVSRATRLCCLVGSARAMQIAARTDGGGRLTGLAQRLAGLGVVRDVLGDEMIPTGPAPIEEDVF